MRPGKFHLVVIIVIVLVIAIEGEFLIELLSAILETVIKGLEMIFETLFEVLLGLSPRGAQVLTAWLAAGLVLGGSALFLSRRGRILRQTLIDSWRESIRRSHGLVCPQSPHPDFHPFRRHFAVVADSVLAVTNKLNGKTRDEALGLFYRNGSPFCFILRPSRQ